MARHVDGGMVGVRVFKGLFCSVEVAEAMAFLKGVTLAVERGWLW